MYCFFLHICQVHHHHQHHNYHYNQHYFNNVLILLKGDNYSQIEFFFSKNNFYLLFYIILIIIFFFFLRFFEIFYLYFPYKYIISFRVGAFRYFFNRHCHACRNAYGHNHRNGHHQHVCQISCVHNRHIVYFYQ